MSIRDQLYRWWKRHPRHFRKPAVFSFGLLLIICAPLVGWIPGPGGIILFLTGISVLASEFGWAESLKGFFLETVPKELKNRWQPTPKWSLAFDVTSVLLLAGAYGALYLDKLAPVFSLGIAGICLFMFNRDRLGRLKKRLRRK